MKELRKEILYYIVEGAHSLYFQLLKKRGLEE
jgi:hypothetical protein